MKKIMLNATNHGELVEFALVSDNVVSIISMQLDKVILKEDFLSLEDAVADYPFYEEQLKSAA